MNHFMQDGFFEFIGSSELKQGLRKLYRAWAKTFVFTCTSTESHLRWPFNSTFFKNAIKEKLVVVLEKDIDVVDCINIFRVEVRVSWVHIRNKDLLSLTLKWSLNLIDCKFINFGSSSLIAKFQQLSWTNIFKKWKIYQWKILSLFKRHQIYLLFTFSSSLQPEVQ